MNPIRPTRAAVMALATATLLAGCGGGSGPGNGGSTTAAATTLADNGVADLAPQEMLAKTKDALRRLPRSSQGQRVQRGPADRA